MNKRVQQHLRERGISAISFLDGNINNCQTQDLNCKLGQVVRLKLWGEHNQAL